MNLKKMFVAPFKALFNVRAWLNYDLLLSHTKSVVDLTKDSLKIVKPIKADHSDPKSFTEEMQRIGTTEEELPVIAARYQLYSLMYCLFLFLDALYALSLWYKLAVNAAIVATALLGLLLVQAVKYHLWGLKITKRNFKYNIQDLINNWLK